MTRIEVALILLFLIFTIVKCRRVGYVMLASALVTGVLAFLLLWLFIGAPVLGLAYFFINGELMSNDTLNRIGESFWSPRVFLWFIVFFAALIMWRMQQVSLCEERENYWRALRKEAENYRGSSERLSDEIEAL